MRMAPAPRALAGHGHHQRYAVFRCVMVQDRLYPPLPAARDAPASLFAATGHRHRSCRVHRLRRLTDGGEAEPTPVTGLTGVRPTSSWPGCPTSGGTIAGVSSEAFHRLPRGALLDADGSCLADRRGPTVDAFGGHTDSRMGGRGVLQRQLLGVVIDPRMLGACAAAAATQQDDRGARPARLTGAAEGPSAPPRWAAATRGPTAGAARSGRPARWIPRGRARPAVAAAARAGR